MRKILSLLIVFITCSLNIHSQVFDLSLTSGESGNQVHVARNSITFGYNYSYTPTGGVMTADIQNPIVTGDAAYYSVINPETRTLNTSFLTGSTSGSFNISQTGGATYSVPLSLPPGISSHQPGIGISYNSMSGNGSVGFGWNISGISCISRSPQNCYNDERTLGIELDITDRFSLDGQRLICISGVYGGNGSIYRTENDVFSKITSYSDVNGTTQFLVNTKDGYEIQYGYQDNSDQNIGTQGKILCWYVNKIKDVYGNEINFEYLHDNGAIYPGEITYGPNVITFYYKNRSDESTSYIKGNSINQSLLLDMVDVKYNSNIVRRYAFKYNYSNSNYTRYSLLNEIIEYGAGGSSRMNSTVFSYQTPESVNFTQNEYNTTNTFVSYSSKLVSGDYNGDGNTDFLCIPNNEANWTGLKVYFGDGNENFNFGFSNATSIDIDNLDDIYAMDINGDGKDDILYETYSSSTSTFHYMLSDGTSFYTQGSILSQPRGSVSGLSGKKRRIAKQENDNQMHSADYNGDGINDIFLNDPSGNWRMMSFAYSSNMPSTVLFTKASGTVSDMTDQIYSNDFNGDGKTDIWSITDNGLSVYTMDGTTRSALYTSSALTSNHFFNLGDFNADGRTDILIYGYKNGSTEYDLSEWQMWISNGTGFDIKYIPQKKSNLKNDYVRLGDFNGDGCTDLMVSSSNQSWSGTYFYISKNEGSDFYTNSLPSYPPASHNYYLSDFNSDGKTDFICTGGESPWWQGYQMYSTNSKSRILLENISDGNNHLTALTYANLSGYGSPYTMGSGASFPVRDFRGALPVVSQVVSDNGIGGQNSISYAYEGAKIHLQGKGFLCYAKTTMTDVTSGLVAETISGYDDTYFYPKATLVTNKTSGGTTIGTTSNTWSHKVFDNIEKRIFPYISSSTQSDNLTGNSITATATYDDYGNLTHSVKTFNNGVSETTDNTYSTDLSNWLLGRLTNTTVTNARSGEASVTRSVRYTYNNNGITKPEYIYYNEGTSLQYYDKYEYCRNGNIKSTYTYGSSIGGSTVSYDYKPDSIRVYHYTDELGRVTIYNYDSYGRKSSDEILGNTTSYQYDAMGRKTYEYLADGSQSNASYLWSGTNKPSLAVYGVSTSGNDGSSATVWYDKLNREILSEKKTFDGTMILAQSEYNVKGQVYRISDPYSAGSSPVWAETYSYDDYGRKTSVTRNTGLNTSFSYSGNAVTETTAGKVYTKAYGPDGTLISASDAGGTILYAYYSDGKLKNVTAPGNVVTSMQYGDAARNQTQISDPSAGVTNYTYDALGRIKTQTDARNRQTTYNYHSDGRLNTIVTPEGTTSYSYNTNKQVSSITSPGSVSRSYSYDSRSRISGISETIAGSTFSTTLAYDSYGRLSSRTHPSGVVETFGYNGNGYLSSVSAGGSPVYTITSMNARQQVTAATLSSSMYATYGFDSFGYPTYSKAVAYGVNKQDYRYSFNPTTGNPAYRRNYLRSLQESFSYDTLGRLTGVSGPRNLTTSYANSNGNILKKAHLADTISYAYGANAGPYAMTSVTAPNGLIPNVNQFVGYTSFEKVDTIFEAPYKARFLYNSENQRARMVVSRNDTTKLTRWYAGSRYMKETSGTTTKEYTYLGGDAYSAPVVAVTEGGTTSYYYLLRDYLGNVTHVVNSSYGISGEYSYDAWGRRRSADDWSYMLDANDTEQMAGRGFTGHEHLPWFNLINMNGRLYNPVVGRFLSPDPYVQSPDFTQNFNRYSYCLNNPLKYTDPSGEIFVIDDIIVAAMMGGMINVAIQGFSGKINNIGDFGLAFGIGALAGAGGAFIGGAVAGAIGFGGFAGGATIGAASGFTGGFVGGSGNAWMNGSNFGVGLMAGLKGGAFGAVSGGLFGGAIAGFDALRNGGNFWNGKVYETGGEFGSNGTFLDEKIPSGHKPTETGEIATRSDNPNYGKYGYTRNGGSKPHFGVDYAGEEGDNVYAMYDGTVTKVGGSKSYGPNFVRTSSVINGKNYNVDYGHMSQSAVIINKTVTAGQQVGQIGRMGIPAGMPTHVHIAIWRSVNRLQGFVMPWWE